MDNDELVVRAHAVLGAEGCDPRLVVWAIFVDEDECATLRGERSFKPLQAAADAGPHNSGSGSSSRRKRTAWTTSRGPRFFSALSSAIFSSIAPSSASQRRNMRPLGARTASSRSRRLRSDVRIMPLPAQATAWGLAIVGP